MLLRCCYQVDLDAQTKNAWPYLGTDGNPFEFRGGLVAKVSCYAFPMRCPVTAGKRMMVAVCGGSIPPMVLRTSYAMSGTDIEVAATKAGREEGADGITWDALSSIV
eukprot:2595712-Rhodomonas_salina.1